ncbi:phosphonate metabolism protein/1,5-bisphosphokinase (PRPP-forming) PhnN [Rhizobiaceae bacterium BDR2-2]|uniref:Ribose 1,5-bisphosphate phosphokinase PhnN n=1 Tax=Ectorhizobium quercum TaxID=2965071 RepID=A0AAE3MVE4_9HYPH|nr:phosphonate metabolism protein/1,5-bisphosphokinase (PRPP-forming) PhnN [Ectorhizobium quercum]MCX8995638.1 phosphonate metabolism protein/1,5-bisphosphokinase (PRPP-forming) PhnN [Ectorhizobium quercum]
MDCTTGTGRGALIVVVGPSGAGKDTLMDAARRHFAGRADIHFVRRVITRPAEAGGEDHAAVSREEFDRLVAADTFAVWWGAHGLKYGVPRTTCEELARGHVAVVNGSRSALRAFGRIFTRVKVISITATPEVLAERLAARGRESREEILNRLARAPQEIDCDLDVLTIDNSGRLEDTVNAFVTALEEAAAERV